MERFLLILKLIPAIVALVQSAETLIPGKGHGKTKLDLVLNTVNTAAQLTPEVLHTLPEKDLEKTTTAIVNATVSTLNTAGVFDHSTPGDVQP